MNAILLFAPAVAAAVVSLMLAPLALKLAVRMGAVDRPGPRKIHAAPIPRSGGLAVIGAVTLVSALRFLLPDLSPALPREVWTGIGVGLLPILAVSIRDDIRPLGSGPKFAAHFLGAAIAVWLGVSVSNEIHMFGRTISIGLFSIPISMLWLVGLTNAFNLVDGLDGLSAGLGLISSLSLGAVFVLTNQTGLASVVLTLAGALAGFLPYNFYPARMFLGDTGATAVGFCLAAVTLRSRSTLSAGFATLLPVFVLGLPITETIISMARRVLARVERKGTGGMFEPDSNHVHHRLLALGIGHRRAVLILYGAGLLLAGSALMSMLMTSYQAALLALSLLGAGFVGISRLKYDEFALIRNGVVLRLYDTPALRKSMFVVFVDVLLVAVAVYGAVALKTDDWWLQTFRPSAFLMIAILAPITVLVFTQFGIYRGAWRFADARDFMRAGSAVAVAAGIGSVAANLVPHDIVLLRSLFLIYGLVSIVLVVGSRASYQVFLALQRNRTGVKALIYGAGREGVQMLRALGSDVDGSLRPVGFIDDDPTKAGTMINGLPVVGSIGSLERAIRRFAAQTVVVCSSSIPAARLAEAQALCRKLGIELVKMGLNVERLAMGMSPTSPPAYAVVEAVPPLKPTSTSLAAADSDQPWPMMVRHSCLKCGSPSLRRSQLKGGLDQLRSKFTEKRPYRCKSCHSRAWSPVLDVAVTPGRSSARDDALFLQSMDTLLAEASPSPAAHV